jgi:hypothetical protein
MLSLARFSMLMSLAVFGCSSIRAQQRRPDCASMPYEDHNQIDYGPLRVTSVRGTVKAVDNYPVFQACVGIFTEHGEKLLATGAANEAGDFVIPSLPNGTYRLVLTSKGFCSANVVVVLKNKPHGKKKLIAVVKPSAVDACSYIELE